MPNFEQAVRDFQKAVPKVVSDFGPIFADQIESPDGFFGFGKVGGDSDDPDMLFGEFEEILRYWKGLTIVGGFGRGLRVFLKIWTDSKVSVDLEWFSALERI